MAYWGDSYDSVAAANRNQDWGGLFNKMQSDWNARSMADRLASRGITQGTEDQQGVYFQGSGEDRHALSFDGSQPGYQNIEQAGAFDPRSFTDKYRVLALNAAQNGNETYDPNGGRYFMPNGQQGNLLQFLNSVGDGSGGSLSPDGQFYVPNNPGAFDPYRDFSPKRGGNFLDKMVMGAADSGALVQGLGGAVLGAGALMGGGSPLSAITNSLGGTLANVGSGASSMFDFFDPSTWTDTATGAFDMGGSTGFGGSTPLDTPSWMRDYFNDFTPGTFDGPGGPVAGDITGLGGPNGGSIQNVIRTLMQGGGGNTRGGGSGIINLLRDLGLGDGISDIIGGAVDTAPVIAALNYARNQNPIDTGPLTNLANQYDPKAQALGYDLDTAHQRTALDASLANRGVAGSSFGNFDQASFDTLRGLGRSNLINQGAGTQAGIYGLINQGNLQSQQLKNQLLGSGLNALGLMANPRRGVSVSLPDGSRPAM